ncbi:class GN sortase [Aliikangiella sp. IMCC44359]|uniref:class GN sortase n=1 Tax=Aliikangiella sp. IMCC44359 TaxID=3459125 RepID=UPI00403B0A2F
MQKTFKVTAFILIFTGLLGVAEKGYYQVKAEVAQTLLEKAWQNSKRETSQNFKPWPWADVWPILKLSLLKSTQQKSNNVSASFIVLSDTSGESLAFGPGLLTANILPGDFGNSLIAAHRDTHFSHLADVNINDLIKIELKDGSLLYFKVDELLIVDSNVTKPIVDLDEKRITLVTCYPFDVNVTNTPLRLLVSGIKITLND